MQSVKLLKGDCLELMKGIPDGSVDMILCDLPYGITANKWDSVIPFDILWKQYDRIVKDHGAICLFGSQPFTSKLICSNEKEYRHSWIWDKVNGGNPFLSKYQPKKVSEDICVFSKQKVNYFPIMEPKKPSNLRNRNVKSKGSTNWSTNVIMTPSSDNAHSLQYPKNIIRVNSWSAELNHAHKRLHPTQKPVKLLEYLIKTYTNEGEVVLDNTMGSGSTGVACINTNRNFIGMELEEKYYDIATKRIEQAKKEASMGA